MNQLFTLISVFSYLSLLTVGGGMAAFPELHTLTVDVHHWLTSTQLIHLYSFGQIAPGPNFMMVVTIGERVDGAVGALVVFLAFFLPTSILTVGIGRLWARLENWSWRIAIQRGLAPVAIGLYVSGAISISEGVVRDTMAFGFYAVWTALCIALAVFSILIFSSRINPALLIFVAAFIGLFAFGGV
jgi:chromate transporter